MLAFLLLVACAPEPQDAPPECLRTYFRDADGDWHGTPDETTTACDVPDGYAKQGDDCDDADASVHPEAPETCDRIDDDCDGEVDEDAIDVSTWYADDDRDGYGLDTDVVFGCAPEGYVAIAGDCDDQAFAVNPDADELCSGIDEDCDGLVDSLDPTLIDGTISYVDLDEDGYGDPSSGLRACEDAKDRILDATDCDDADPDVRPGAAEVCDRVDNDCDTMVDDADEGIVGAATFYLDADGDGLGDPAVAIDACYEPEGYLMNADDCDDADAEVGEPPGYFTDVDGDGYGEDAPPVFTCTPAVDQVRAKGDCAPYDEAISPAATEVCDGRDNDCDDVRDGADPSVVADTWYRDADRDTYGDPTDTRSSCHGSPGYVATSGDCDDGITTTHDGADEYCDGVDNDCDGTVDDSVVYVDWFADDDGDLYGDPSDGKNACVQPSGYVLDHSDCDDGLATASPDGTEVCANGVDEDCDDAVDNCDLPLDDAALTIEGPPDSTFCTVATTADLDADGIADLVFASHWANGRLGGVYTTTLPATGTVQADDGVTIAQTTTGTRFGRSVAGGDTDGDGFDDLAVGAPNPSTTFLFLGPVTADLETADADVELVGVSGDDAGLAVAIFADHDGDGSPDIVIGAPSALDATGYRGSAYVIGGATSGSTNLRADATYLYRGPAGYGHVGAPLTEVGDQNGDGIRDLTLSGYTSSSEAVYVIEGGATPGTYDVEAVASATVSVTGPLSHDVYFGSSVAAGDHDGDGTADLFVGSLYADSPYADAGGVVYGFRGPLSGAIASHDAEVIWNSEQEGEYLGFAIATGDVDDDKRADLLIAGKTGQAYLQLGPATGVVGTSALVHFTGASARVAAVAFVPDWSGNDESEVLLGSPSADGSAGSDTGIARLFLSETLAY